MYPAWTKRLKIESAEAPASTTPIVTDGSNFPQRTLFVSNGVWEPTAAVADHQFTDVASAVAQATTLLEASPLPVTIVIYTGTYSEAIILPVGVSLVGVDGTVTLDNVASTSVVPAAGPVTDILLDNVKIVRGDFTSLPDDTRVTFTRCRVGASSDFGYNGVTGTVLLLDDCMLDFDRPDPLVLTNLHFTMRGCATGDLIGTGAVQISGAATVGAIHECHFISMTVFVQQLAETLRFTGCTLDTFTYRDLTTLAPAVVVEFDQCDGIEFRAFMSGDLRMRDCHLTGGTQSELQLVSDGRANSGNSQLFSVLFDGLFTITNYPLTMINCQFLTQLVATTSLVAALNTDIFTISFTGEAGNGTQLSLAHSTVLGNIIATNMLLNARASTAGSVVADGVLSVQASQSFFTLFQTQNTVTAAPVSPGMLFEQCTIATGVFQSDVANPLDITFRGCTIDRLTAAESCNWSMHAHTCTVDRLVFGTNTVSTMHATNCSFTDSVLLAGVTTQHSFKNCMVHILNVDTINTQINGIQSQFNNFAGAGIGSLQLDRSVLSGTGTIAPNASFATVSLIGIPSFPLTSSNYFVNVTRTSPSPTAISLSVQSKANDEFEVHIAPTNPVAVTFDWTLTLNVGIVVP